MPLNIWQMLAANQAPQNMTPMNQSGIQQVPPPRNVAQLSPDYSGMMPEDFAPDGSGPMSMPQAPQVPPGPPTPQDFAKAQGLPLRSISATLGRSQADEELFKKQFDDLYKKNQEYMGGQESGVRDLESEINKAKDMPQRADLSSLMALADAWSPDKSNLAQTYKAPENPEARQQRLIGLTEALQQRKSDLSKSQAQTLQEMINAHKASNDTDQLKLMLAAQRGTDTAGGRLDKRLDYMAHATTIRNLNSSPAIRDSLYSINRLDRANNLMFQPPKDGEAAIGGVAVQVLNEYQQAIQQAVQKGGSTGINERADKTFNTGGWDLKKWEQFATGKLKPVQLTDPMVQVLKHFADTERDTIQGQFTKQAVALGSKGGFGYLYDPKSPKYNPLYADALKQKISAMQDQVAVPNAGGGKAGGLTPEEEAFMLDYESRMGQGQ